MFKIIKDWFIGSIGRTKAGITIQPDVDVTSLEYCSDPWYFFIHFDITNVLRLIAQSESLQFCESKHNLFRETLVSRPGVGILTTRSVVESQIVTNNATQVVTQDSTRERDRFMVAITPIIWIAGHILAFDRNARVQFTNTCISQGIMVPTVISELFKRTRNCENTLYRWTLGLIQDSWVRLLNDHPELENTFWDPNFFDENGVNLFVAFIQFIGNKEGNYVPMVQASPQSLPPLESGNMVTMNSITVRFGHNFLRPITYMIENSMAGPNLIFLSDAVLGTYVYTDLNDERFEEHYNTAGRCRISATLTQWCEHMVLRVTGIEPNNNRILDAEQGPPVQKVRNQQPRNQRPRQEYVAPKRTETKTTEPPPQSRRSDDTKPTEPSKMIDSVIHSFMPALFQRIKDVISADPEYTAYLKYVAQQKRENYKRSDYFSFQY